ncbi:TetR/AcrR family transcriptional regulator [Umezawaea endophytica]|uniref:TetR/AcrR family transcriptional regulator n=1 Tax=Umezawaea endophytica TaxID=1654476 RepID=A0A9X2VXC3_9PSEU|nr:TetR/AcrR family transcriptional regulator [Umezawaea endophytica]MCS7484533.1 TetR/AcrR family transcriptional regulator [Umezawaea endophytica]
MTQQNGLRERKKQRTHETISNTAIALFFEHGYDQVSITQVADAAEVSRRTLFSYFPSKEDLVTHRLADHETESARVVRGRPSGQSPLDALREHYLDGLARRDPITGLTDLEPALMLYRLILETPSLAGGMLKFKDNGERALAEALRDTAGLPDFTARLAAAQVMAVVWTLSLANREAVVAGAGADAVYPDAVAAAEAGFAQLASGLGVVAAEHP